MLDLGERPELPLSTAMAFSSCKVIELLLDFRANPHHENNLLFRAAQFDRNDAVEIWLQRFSDLDLEIRNPKYGTTPLLQFLYYCSQDANNLMTLKKMLDARCNPNSVNYFGMGVLHAVSFNQNAVPDIIELLLQRRADVNKPMMPQNDFWRAELKQARDAVDAGNSNEISRELSKWEGATALMLAACRGKGVEVRHLLEARADVDVRNLRGHTALQMARSVFGNTEDNYLIQMLRSEKGSSSGQLEAAKDIEVGHPQLEEAIQNYICTSMSTSHRFARLLSAK
jgi:ankyrin repeat protein